MRNTQVIRWTRLIERMMDGRPKTLVDFEDIHAGCIKKTAVRDLMGLVTVEELEITTYLREGVRFWRMDKKFKPSKLENKKKKCRVCGELKFVEDEYFRNPNTADGRETECKVCRMKRVRKWQEKNPDRVKKAKYDWLIRNRKRVNAQRRESRKITKTKITYGGTEN